ncbi:hypothetical protein CUZ93_1928 [Enterococcus xinjiangensis]|nr:hypothetical protein [Enterococcus lactis]MBL5001643.1 hypothetical protein [Enterococcus lactis]
MECICTTIYEIFKTPSSYYDNILLGGEIMKVTGDGLLGLLGSIVGVIGAYIVAVWQNKSEARNKMILELNTIEERANTVLNYTYATNENLNVELFPMQIELTHPMFGSVEKMKRIYPLLNQKILRLIERLNVQVQQFEMTLNGVVLDHHNNLLPPSYHNDDPKSYVLVQSYIFGNQQKVVDEYNELIKRVKQIKRSINIPLYLFFISKFSWYKEPPTLHL